MTLMESLVDRQQEYNAIMAEWLLYHPSKRARRSTWWRRLWPFVSLSAYEACLSQLITANRQNLEIPGLRKTIDDNHAQFQRIIGYLTENQREEMRRIDAAVTEYPSHPYRSIHVVGIRKEWQEELHMLAAVLEISPLREATAARFELGRLKARIKTALEV